MNWFWKVRIYNSADTYWYGQVKTTRDLCEIDAIQDFYKTLTGCKMLIEGMSENPFKEAYEISDAFANLWRIKI